jgi:Zn-dependent M28 family amino/carboxypeptidase
MPVMRRTAFLSSAPLVLALAAHAKAPAKLAFDGSTWWSHVEALADDAMEGRDTGSAGIRKAQAYVVEQLTRSGLQPAGRSGFYQPVRLISRQIVESESSASLVQEGKAEPLRLGEDAYFSTQADLVATPVEAPLVFVGYGLRVPEQAHDDLDGLDVRGKIVVFLQGSPASLEAALAAHYQVLGERWKPLRSAGARGIIRIPNPAAMDVPWSRMALNRAHASMSLTDPEFDETSGLETMLTINPAYAEKLFAGSGHSFAELAALAKERQPLPRFPLALSLKAQATVRKAPVECANVVARLAGTDPALKNEHVVLSAHIDHVGIGEPIDGDRIYNGAMDDGSGSALLLEMAAHLKGAPLRRSVLFVFVTGEEKGLLGSKYFAAHPSVAAGSLVADINVDMFLPIVPLKVLRVQGLDESDLGDRARDIAQSHGVRAIPDPEPLRNLFIRSDQYSFIRNGIPSVIMDVGFNPGSPEQAIFKDWLTRRYHAPSDDTTQPVELGAAALYEEIVRRLLVEVANADARPRWKPTSFFRRYASAGR